MVVPLMLLGDCKAARGPSAATCAMTDTQLAAGVAGMTPGAYWCRPAAVNPFALERPRCIQAFVSANKRM